MTAELPWTSVGVATDYSGNARVLTASATGHGTSTANVTVVAMARGRGSVRGKLRRTNHGKPRKSTAIATATAVSAETAVTISTAIRGHCHGNAAITEFRGSPWQLPRQFSRTFNPSSFHGHPRPSTETAVAISTAIRGHCHGNAAITTEVRGSPRQLPRQFPRTFNPSSFHGHPRPSAAVRVHCRGNPPICADFHGSPRESAAIAAARAAILSRRKLRRTSHAHGCPGPWP